MKSIIYLKNSILNWQKSSKIAIVTDEEEISYQSLFSQSVSLAIWFNSQGLNSGDRIAVKLPNSIEFIYCYFACMLGGFTIVPINTALPQNNIKYILDVAKPKLFIDSLETINLTKKPILNQKIKINNDNIFSIFFTSGTTNLPKGVCHSLESIIANVLEFNDLVGLNENTVMMHVLPMGYMAGFLNTILSPILAGGKVIVAHQFNAQQAMNFWEPAVKNNINTMWLTPTMAALLVKLNRDNNVTKWTEKNLNYVFIGTAPLRKTVREDFEKTFKTKCLESYGMTEILITASNVIENQQKESSVGLLVNKIEVEIRDKNGKSLHRKATGEIYVRSPFVLNGYIDTSQKSIYSPLKDGWFATGDYGYIDDDNYLFITGRIKDLIIRGGTNISPRAVEEIILAHPDIKDVAIIGKQNPFWEQEISRSQKPLQWQWFPIPDPAWFPRKSAFFGQ